MIDRLRISRAGRAAGITLIELLVAIVVMGIVTAGTLSLFTSQSRAFRGNSDRFDLVQNVRGAVEISERVMRTMGAGTTGDQPVLVYGSASVLAFNTDYVEPDTVDMRWAAYFNTDVPAADGVAWDAASAGAIPGSSPSYTYPLKTYRMGNGSVSPAETYIFYFELDASTARTDDYALVHRVNNGPAEVVSRSILPLPGGRPFLQYLMQRVLPTGDTLLLVPTSLQPLVRRELVSGITAVDSANYVRPDSVRAVRLNFRVTNGHTGAAERFRDVTTTVEVPNNGIPMPSVCGRVPLEPSTLSVVDTVPGSGRVWLTWSRSVDQDAGEQDVRQYILFRRLVGATTWSDPIVVTRAELTQTTYTVELSGNLPGTSYTFGIAAQDCTPLQSSIRTVNITTSVP